MLFRFIVRRAVESLVSLAGACLLVFLVVRAAPGDPAGNLLGPLATPAQMADLRASLGLDKSLPAQFGIWVTGVLHGDFGTSISQNRAVVTVLGEAWRTTVMLSALSALIAIVIGLVLGNLSSRGPAPSRRGADLAEAALLSAPEYTVALVLLTVLCVVVPLFPSGGLGTDGLGDLLSHLTLPALALALPPGAMIGRSLKTALANPAIEELVPSLRARGISTPAVLAHVHRNALPSVITVTGIQVGTMLGGAVFVETIFSLPGLGNLALQAIGPRDYPLLQGVLLLVAMMFIGIMLVADVLAAVIDPRIRRGTAR
ncbi:peptide ABC transporter permease [Acrocarpospora pleiomorpha]|uniref:Peptide ABC transporter permease n=1 Tax=Acrocarpospora pleiomorpha TaxID=90975 RepID=A0A5M3XSK5_9ACTN|nr:ABC transporter permease [Acrocarpospora pleiomorpha]GES24245.1 peptide ABC transporter permease [Acrocarpospora pleiomorpha]